jgi:hypothetical protein
MRVAVEVPPAAAGRTASLTLHLFFLRASLLVLRRSCGQIVLSAKSFAYP